MNILFTAINPFYPPFGGLQKVTDTLCRELIALKNNVYYLNLTWCREECKSYLYPANSVTILPESDIYSEENITFYNKFIKDKGIDVVINQNGLYEGASLFCKVYDKKVKLISVVHNNPLLNYNYIWNELSYLRNNTWIERLKRIFRCLLYFRVKQQRLTYLKQHYTQFDGDNHSVLVLLSSRYKKPLLRIAPHLSTRLYSIANPNSYEDICEFPQKQKEIIFVGRLDNNSKKVNRLLKIWKHIYKEFPEWMLSVVGEGPDRLELENYSARLGLENIVFYGYSDPKPFYKRASIICMTSDFEGFPMVLTEAMQFGCVPIAYNSFEAIEDVIIDEITGILVQPFNEFRYVEDLRKVMSDDSYRHKLAQSAFEYVKRFNVKNIVRMWTNLINQL